MTKFFAPALALGVAATALTAGAASADATGFRSCAAVRAAGIPTPIPFGAPHYQANLDADNDGWACEPPGVNLPDPRKAHHPVSTKPAPTKATPTTKPATPAPVVQAPAAPVTPAKPGTGPVVQTDRVTSSDDAASTYGVLALVGAAAGASVLRIRSLKR